MFPIYDLEECTCIKCGKKIPLNTIAYYHNVCEAFTCCDCAGENPIGYSRFMVKNGTGHLILTKASFQKLEDNVYEIKRFKNGPSLEFYVERVKKENDSIESFRSDMRGESLLLEIMDRDYVVLLTEFPVISAQKFVTEDALCNDNFFHLSRIAFKPNIQYLTDKYDNIRGISNLSYDGIDDGCFETYTSISASYTKDQLKEKFSGFRGVVAESLRKFSPRELYEYCRKRVRGQDEELKKAVYLICNYLKTASQKNKFSAQNWALTAPSGSGKTEFFRAVRDFFEEHDIPIPVAQVDISHITAEGYKGANATATIPKALIEKNKKSGGIGICFLDEADKKCIRDKEGENWNASIQANLLTIIEGKEFKVELENERGTFDYNSGLTMFVLMGAFQSLRHKKSAVEPVYERPLGFNSDLDTVTAKEDDGETDEFYGDITLQDMIDNGMQEEFAGRISQVINFHKLSEEDMLDVIRAKAEEISEQIGVEIQLTEEAENDLLGASYGTMGIRTPMNIIRTLSQNALAEIFFDEDYGETEKTVVITSVTSAYVKRRKTSLKSVNSDGYNYRVITEEEY